VPPELDLTYHGFTETDLDKEFPTEAMSLTVAPTLRNILEVLRTTYCRSIGVSSCTLMI